MDHPLLGPLAYDAVLDVDEASAPVFVPVFGRAVRFAFAGGYTGDPARHELDAAVAQLLAAGPELLREATAHAIAYRDDTRSLEGVELLPSLAQPDDVWREVRFGDLIYIRRVVGSALEDGVYLAYECNCEWEREHGLQLVLKAGRAVTKLGPFDGHVTNARAYGDARLVGVVYVTRAWVVERMERRRRAEP